MREAHGKFEAERPRDKKTPMALFLIFPELDSFQILDAVLL